VYWKNNGKTGRLTGLRDRAYSGTSHEPSGSAGVPPAPWNCSHYSTGPASREPKTGTRRRDASAPRNSPLRKGGRDGRCRMASGKRMSAAFCRKPPRPVGNENRPRDDDRDKVVLTLTQFLLIILMPNRTICSQYSEPPNSNFLYGIVFHNHQHVRM
jgi:hypothetical protein